MLEHEFGRNDRQTKVKKHVRRYGREENDHDERISYFRSKNYKCKCCRKSGHKDDACYSRSKPKHLWYCNTNQEAKQFYQAAADAATTMSNSRNDSSLIAPSQSGQPSEDDAESVTSSWQMAQYQLSQKLAKAKLLKEALVMDSASSVDLIGN